MNASSFGRLVRRRDGVSALSKAGSRRTETVQERERRGHSLWQNRLLAPRLMRIRRWIACDGLVMSDGRGCAAVIRKLCSRAFQRSCCFCGAAEASSTACLGCGSVAVREADVTVVSAGRRPQAGRRGQVAVISHGCDALRTRSTKIHSKQCLRIEQLQEMGG